MKKTLLTLIITTLLISFNTHAKTPPKETPKEADTSLNGVFLSNPESSVKVLGKKIEITDEDEGPNYSAYNKDKTQTAKFIMHEGDLKNSFNEFSIKYAGKDKGKTTTLTNIESFKTGKGIKLGITRKELVEILGIKFKTKKEKETLTLRYQIETPNKSKFLQTYNMPTYHGEYKFKNNKLVEFSFGFKMP